MPLGDRTGPSGLGPRSGRGAGYCSGSPGPRFRNPAYGSWGGHGRRHWFYATGLTGWQRACCGWPAWARWAGWPSFGAPTQEEELEALKNQASCLEKALERIRSRIDELAGRAKSD